MRRAVVILALLAASLSTAGCKSPCRQLAEKLCDCSLGTQEKEDCIRAAQTQESSVEPTEADQEKCAALLAVPPEDGGCDCRNLESSDTSVRARAKKACGLARE